MRLPHSSDIAYVHLHLGIYGFMLLKIICVYPHPNFNLAQKCPVTSD